MKVRFNKPSLSEEEIDAVAAVLRTGWISRGPVTVEFEKKFAEFSGESCNFLSVNSCTAGLHLSLLAAKKFLGVKRVFTTPVTFPATVNAIVHAGLEPVFVDVKADTLNINEELAVHCSQPGDAIIPVHLFGHPCKMDLLVDSNRVIINDSAHTTEAEYKGKKLCEYGEFSAYSFYATKNMTTAEGGMVAISKELDDEVFDYIEVMSMHGISKNAWKRYEDSSYHHWEAIEHGFKYNLTDIQSAIGLVQLRKLEDFHNRRTEICNLYDSLLSDVIWITPLSTVGDVKHSRHLYPILVDKPRDEVMTFLGQHGVGTGVHFRSLHKHRAFLDISCATPMVHANLTDNILSLPLHPEMTNEEVEYVVSVLRKL